MQGIILDLTAGQIYLEVDQQIRFRSPWVAQPSATPLHVQDRVDFAFSTEHGKPCVVIQSVTPIYKSRRTRAS